jgi:sodium/potassium/calcium exchanger 6
MYLDFFTGFIVAVTWIYVVSNEIVSLLKALAVFFPISDVFAGMILLSLGNSISDLVNNVSMSKRGYPRMAFSACFGGPLFNLLIGIGVPFTMAIGILMI